jgi:hypothetical protein
MCGRLRVVCPVAHAQLSAVNVRDTSNRGRGLFCQFPLKKGDILAVFGGTYAKVKPAADLWVIAVRRSLGGGYVVIDGAEDSEDVSFRPDLAYFANHACDGANAAIVVLTGDQQPVMVVLAAKSDIAPNVEILVDYGADKPVPCLCQSCAACSTPQTNNVNVAAPGTPFFTPLSRLSRDLETNDESDDSEGSIRSSQVRLRHRAISTLHIPNF